MRTANIRFTSLSVFEDTFEISPSTSVKAEAVEQKPPIAARWETFRQKFSPMPGMLDQKWPLPTEKVGESSYMKELCLLSLSQGQMIIKF